MTRAIKLNESQAVRLISNNHYPTAYNEIRTKAGLKKSHTEQPRRICSNVFTVEWIAMSLQGWEEKTTKPEADLTIVHRRLRSEYVAKDGVMLPLQFVIKHGNDVRSFGLTWRPAVTIRHPSQEIPWDASTVSDTRFAITDSTDTSVWRVPPTKTRKIEVKQGTTVKT